jgi:hypothetical protein
MHSGYSLVPAGCNFFGLKARGRSAPFALFGLRPGLRHLPKPAHAAILHSWRFSRQAACRVLRARLLLPDAGAIESIRIQLGVPPARLSRLQSVCRPRQPGSARVATRRPALILLGSTYNRLGARPFHEQTSPFCSRAGSIGRRIARDLSLAYLSSLQRTRRPAVPVFWLGRLRQPVP